MIRLLLLVATAAAPEPKAEVLATLERQVAAWNRGDLEAFCAVYAEDAIFLSPSGVTRTRQAVLDRYLERYPDAASQGVLAIEPLEVRVLGSAVSVAGRWTITRKDAPPATGLTLIVLHRTPRGWEIVQDASM